MAALNCLFEPLKQLEAFQALTEAVRANKLCALYGPDDSQRAHMLAALAHATGRSMLVLAPNEMLAMRMAEDMKGVVITNDFNLNKVAQVQGVKVFNINDLSNAVKPVFLPGEELIPEDQVRAPADEGRAHDKASPQFS